MMLCSWPPWSCLLIFVMLHTCSSQDENTDERPPGFDGEVCYGTQCCHEMDDEFGRQLACAMYVYLDSDPVLQMEGCAKHGGGCKAVCQGEIYELLTAEYSRCDNTYDKDTVVADWYGCFFEGIASGLVNGVSFAYMETEPAINTTQKFCELFVQPGCPLCISLRIPGSPCAISLIQEMCKPQCEACRCHPPKPERFRALELDCNEGGDNDFEWGDRCSLKCPANTSSATDIRCVQGFWNGSDGDASCMNDCQVTGIKLPEQGTNTKLVGWEAPDDDDDAENPGCDYLKHRERCQLNCELGTTPSSWWECYDGKLRSTVEDYEPLCLENCGEPPVPPRAEEFGNCTNPVLEDPDFDQDWSDLFNWGGWNGSNGSNATLNGTALREALEEQGLNDFFAETCKALKEDNDDRPEGDQDSRWNWRRMQALNPQKHRPGSDPSYKTVAASLKKQPKLVPRKLVEVPRRHLAEENGTNDTNDTNGTNETDDDGIFVPANTPHGSTCELKCIYPFTPDSKYFCWNNTWTMPNCIVQLKPGDVQWPMPGRSIVSPLGSLYYDYSLDIVPPNLEDLAIGEKVTVCAKEGIGCPTGQCYAAVPVEDAGRVSTHTNQLRVRFGYDYEKEQRYGCEYEITIPQGTVVAVVDRTVGNDEVKWNYRLDPPPPRLMALEIEPSYSSVFVKIKYNAVGTIKCKVTPRGRRPSLLDMEMQLSFFVQPRENDWASGEIKDLEERTDYSLWCRGTGTAGLSQSMVNVYDNEEQFQTKTKIPYAFNLEVVKLGNKEVVVQILMSGECEVFCIAQQEAEGLFDAEFSQKWVFRTKPAMFLEEPIEMTLSKLKPNMPTQIFCRARAYNEKGLPQWKQPLSDSWKWAQTVTTPAMIVTDLSALEAEGCTLVPDFAPSRPVYACMLPKTSGTASITLSAKVDKQDYSMINCPGGVSTSCEQKFQVSEQEVWTLEVQAQAGNTYSYVIVMMREADITPKEIVPREFMANSVMHNMTICAKAKSKALTEMNMDTTYVQLLPGPWPVPIRKMWTGSDLPTCTCDGCNVEISVAVRGAGKDMIVVIFLNGIPSFTLDAPQRVHFNAPRVEDVNPPNPSIYSDNKLVVLGQNFGGTNDTGAIIKVEKVGPPIGLPAVAWFEDCPVLIVEVSKQSSVPMGSDEEPVDTSWVNGEFRGRYNLIERGKYEQEAFKFVVLSEAQVEQIGQESWSKWVVTDGDEETGVFSDEKDFYANMPDDVYLYVVDSIGMCCYEKLYLVGFHRATRTLQVRIKTQRGGSKKEKGRRMPHLNQQSNIWQFDSRENGDLRLHSSTTNIKQTTGWMVKYRNMPPPPGPLPEEEDEGGAFGGRRLKSKKLTEAFKDPDTKADFGGSKTLRKRLGEFAEMVKHKKRSDLRQLQDDKEAEEAMEEEAEVKDCGDTGNRTVNEKCETTCAEGTDKDSAVDSFLVQMGMDSVPKDLRKCFVLMIFAPDLCAAMRFICQCSCKDYDNTPLKIDVEVHTQCERCGDGLIIGNEECDDGNTRDGDGCSRKCKVEPGWDCSTTPCKNLEETEEEDRNLCGPTTWVDDTTLTCKLSGTSFYPLALSVEVRGQTSEPSQTWIQYNAPVVRSMLVGVAFVTAGDSSEWTKTLELTGGQKIILQGRSLPPTPEEGQKHRLTMLIGETILCAAVEVKSSTSFNCPSAMPIFPLSRVTLDPEVTIRVGEVSSEGVKLSDLGLKLRQPEIYSMEPSVFNDTDPKVFYVMGKYLGTPNLGDFHITIGGAECKVLLHTPEILQCHMTPGYVPIGSYSVEARLGNIPAISTANVTSVPTYCHVGMKRIDIETSECAMCEAGTAEPDVTADFFCPNCTNAKYQNDTGTTACQDCEEHTFSVLNRSTKAFCRCEAGYYHKYGNAGLSEECTLCEHDRGFGWATDNWTVDCEDCVQKYTKPPQEWDYFGDCSASCYGLECHPCPRGAVCFGNAAWPRVLPGWWAVDVFEKDAGGIERCMPMEACLGDNGFGEMICEVGYEGIRCGVCELGYYKDQHKCWKCPNNQWIFALIFMLFFLCVLFFGIIPAQLLFMSRLLGIETEIPWVWRCWFKLCCCCKNCCCCKKRNQDAQDEDQENRRPGRCWRLLACCGCVKHIERVKNWDARLGKAPLLRTLAMCLNFGHTCYAFAMLQRPAVNWPGPSWELLSWTKLLTIDVEFMKPDCVVQMPYFQKWIGKFFMPFGLIVLLFLITLYLGRGVKRRASVVHGDAALSGRPSVWQVFRFSLALVIHVILIWHLKVALSPVDCNWCREGVTCLDEYTLVECWGDDPTWIKMMIISALDFVFVSGFFPIFLTIMLCRGWRASAKEDNAPKWKKTVRMEAHLGAGATRPDFTNFFVSGYRNREDGGYFLTYAWEVVVLVRKLALILSAKFTSTDPVRGANLQLLILLVALVMQFAIRPYQASILNNIDNCLTVLLFLSLLSACQLTMGGLGEMEPIYVAINIVALFGGAIMAMGVCLRKVMHAYHTEMHNKKLRETRRAAASQIEGEDADDANSNADADEVDVVPVDDVKEGDSPKKAAEAEENDAHREADKFAEAIDTAIKADQANGTEEVFL